MDDVSRMEELHCAQKIVNYLDRVAFSYFSLSRLVQKLFQICLHVFHNDEKSHAVFSAVLLSGRKQVN